MRRAPRTRATLLAVLFSLATSIAQSQAQPVEPLQYTFRVVDAAKHIAEIEARIPSSGQPTLDLMMPVWTPGFYRVEDYAGRVQSLVAKTPDGVVLDVVRPRPNRWQVTTTGSPVVVLSYRLLCQGRSVTSNWVDDSLGVINGGTAFITLVDRAPRPHDVRIEMPPTWRASASGLEPAPDGLPNHYRAADFDTLVDSPIVAGTLAVREFVVDGSTHVIADAGEYSLWDGARAAKDLEKMVRETRTFWGFLPFKRYVFLNVFRQGGGGLEHSNSTLLTSSPKSTTPTQGWLSFVAHEYFHAFNVKRLRPVELGPFDYESPPTTTSLWISEGATTYLGNLMLARAGLMTAEEFLGSMSSAIAQLQKSPGRLVQSLEQSSAEVWTNSNSGVGASNGTVSYYGKGNVVSFLLDAHIRRITNGSKSFDDAIRLAYKRYGGQRGFTADELRTTFEEVAGKSLKPWFAKAIGSAGELDYSEMLGWYGLRFAGGQNESWTLEARPRATSAQRKHLAALLSSSPRHR
jgi:predicted metalloprotease with PDZ domain